MPTYRYRARAAEPGCERCRPGFELRQSISDEPMSACPVCGGAVERVLFPPFVAGGDDHRLREGHLEKHGFTQYRKVEKGVYEKTAGRGPDRIRDD